MNKMLGPLPAITACLMVSLLGIPHPSASNKVGPPAFGIPAVSAISLVFAIADHPWVNSANGAPVRIAMTVGCRVLLMLFIT